MGKRAEMISLGRISDHVNNSGIRLNNQHVMELQDQLYIEERVSPIQGSSHVCWEGIDKG